MIPNASASVVMPTVSGCPSCATDWGTQQAYDAYALQANPAATTVPQTSSFPGMPSGVDGHEYDLARGFATDSAAASDATATDLLAAGAADSAGASGFFAGASSLPVIGLAAADAWLLWHDGNMLADLLAPGADPSATTTGWPHITAQNPSQYQAQFVAKGADLYAPESCSPGVDCTQMPYDGMQLTWYAGIYGDRRSQVAAADDLPGWTRVREGSCCGGAGAKWAYIQPVKQRHPRAWTGGSADVTTAPRTLPTFDQTWANRFAGSLNNHPTAAAQLEAHMRPATGTVPDCRGLLSGNCASVWASAGFTSSPNVVHLDFNGADLTKPADSVISTNPAQGASVPLASPLTVTANPLPADMPLAIPAPLAHETYAAYVARLQALGLTGTITRLDLTDGTLDTGRGPNEAVSTDPATGTRVHPADAVQVRTNPATAPAPAGGGGISLPAIPAVDLSPLSHVSPCNVFPFGVPCWISNWFGGWSSAAAAPAFDLFMPFWNKSLHIDFGIGNPIMVILRPVFLILSLLLLGWAFMAAAMGFGGSSGTEDA